MSAQIGKENRITLTLAQKGLVLIGVPLLFELVFVGMLTALLGQAEHEALRVVQSKQIINKTNNLFRLVAEAGNSLAGYAVHKNARVEEHYQAVVEEISAELTELKRLSEGNTFQQARLDKLSGTVENGLDRIKRIKQELDAGSSQKESAVGPDNRTEIKNLPALTDCLKRELNQFNEYERRIEKNSPQMERRFATLVHYLLWIGTALNILLSLFMAHLFYTGITGRLRILTDNAIRLARNEPLNPAIAGTDEVAYLDSVFHEMAGALAAAAKKEHSIIENAVDVICSIDENGKFIAISPASTKIFGYQPEELIGRRFTELILPEDIEATLDCTRAVMLNQSLLPFENRVMRKNGTIVFILWSAYWSAAERCMFCVAHDIGDRKLAEDMLKESELRTRSIIESMPVGLLIISDHGQIELVNPQVEKMFDMSADEFIDQHISQLFPRQEEFQPKNFKAGIPLKLTGRVREFKARRKNGENFPAELTIIKFNTIDGTRLLVNILDLTERHSVERLKREFVTTVSHELRTPLTSIRGSLTLLSMGALGPLADQAMRAVKIAERNALRLVSLINDLLDIEKLEAGKMDMVFEKVKISTVIEKSFESVRPYADQYDIALELKMDGDFEICADGDRLVQVFINLISNAVKFSPRNDHVLVEGVADGDHVKISISDHGRGIPPEIIGRIFERFQQVEAADAKRKGGTGLGLAICKAIVEQHSGKIGVESQYGKGSKFWFSLPLWGSPAAPSSRQEELPVAAAQAQETESDNKKTTADQAFQESEGQKPA